jgi:signal transduction histidine kinase
MASNFYILFIIVGLTLFSVMLYYNKILTNFLSILSSLLKLQENRETEIKAYLLIVENRLKDIGVREVFYDIKYSKKRIFKSNNIKNDNILKKDIYYKNINGYIAISVENNRGEYKLINKLILYVLTLQVVNAIHTDIEKINESFERIAKLQTYMMHDLKNILQFFQAMQYNIEHLESDEEKKQFIEFLQTSTTPINKKVSKILALVQVKSNIDIDKTDTKLLDLRVICEQYVKQYALVCDIEGEGTIDINEENIRVIIDNILTNIKDKSYFRDDVKCNIKIIDSEKYVDIIISDNGMAFENPNEVCEPFYTTKTDGTGIGMYQVLSVVEMMDGSMVCENIDDKAVIKITIPKK